LCEAQGLLRSFLGRVVVAIAKEARVPWKGCAKHVSLGRVVVAIAKEARVPWKGCFFKEGVTSAASPS